MRSSQRGERKVDFVVYGLAHCRLRRVEDFPLVGHLCYAIKNHDGHSEKVMGSDVVVCYARKKTKNKRLNGARRTVEAS